MGYVTLSDLNPQIIQNLSPKNIKGYIMSRVVLNRNLLW